MLPAVAALLAAMPTPAGAADQRTPTDRLVNSQWQYFDGGIEVRSVWAQRVTGGPVVVAVLDSGTDLDHEDLEQNLWTNPGEIAGNDVDDDRNGFVDDVRGADLVDGDGRPSDLEGHGTHVAGVIGARGNNRRGISGVAWRARIMTVRVLNSRRKGTSRQLAAGILYAARHGARVINISANTPTDDPAVRRAIAVAQAADVLIVASAGNAGDDLGSTPSYPACVGSPNVLGVASSTRAGTLSAFSSYGGGCVDLTAPGERIVSTSRRGGYAMRTGTSVATAQVTGAAVLLLAARPSLTSADLVAALTDGARPVGRRTAGASRASRASRPTGAGTLSVARALRVALRG